MLPLPPHTHVIGQSLVLGPWGLTLRAHIPATSLPLLPLSVTHFLLPRPHCNQKGPGKGHPINVPGEDLLWKAFGGQAEAPSLKAIPWDTHSSSAPAWGATLIESPSLSASQGPMRTEDRHLCPACLPD